MIWLWILGIAICLGGLTLAGLSLVILPSKSKRCRRCLYPMEGVPELTCPECGRTARSERSLRRMIVRPRWGRASGALLLALAGAALVLHMESLKHKNGWLALLPTTALVLVFDQSTSPTVALELDSRSVAGMPSWAIEMLVRRAIVRMNGAGTTALLRLGLPSTSLVMRCGRERPAATARCAINMLESGDPAERDAILLTLLRMDAQFIASYLAVERLELPPRYAGARSSPGIRRAGAPYVGRPSIFLPTILDREDVTAELAASVFDAVMRPGSPVTLDEGFNFFLSLPDCDPNILRKVVEAKAASSTDPIVVHCADAFDIAMTRGHRGATFIATYLDDPDYRVRRFAVTALGMMGKEAADVLADVERTAADTHFAVRMDALEAATRIRHAMERSP